MVDTHSMALKKGPVKPLYIYSLVDPYDEHGDHDAGDDETHREGAGTFSLPQKTTGITDCQREQTCQQLKDSGLSQWLH